MIETALARSPAGPYRLQTGSCTSSGGVVHEGARWSAELVVEADRCGEGEERLAMRILRPRSVRAPWRSRVRMSFAVQQIDSMR
jgi:hypothetical protein